MAVLERKVVLTGKENGKETIDLPVTALEYIEADANTKDKPVDSDALPIIDSADGFEMKKISWSELKGALNIVNTPVIETQAGLMTPELLRKLLDIQAGATNYIHPTQHPADMIEESPLKRFVTDEQISAWTEGTGGDSGTDLKSLLESMASIVFQLSLKGLIDATNIVNVFVDIINSADAVDLINGRYESGKVYV